MCVGIESWCSPSGQVLWNSKAVRVIQALPAGNAEIPPHAQVRLILTWTRPPQYDHWRDVPPPKLLIVTKFMDDTTGDNDASATSIRLIVSYFSCVWGKLI